MGKTGSKSEQARSGFADQLRNAAADIHLQTSEPASPVQEVTEPPLELEMEVEPESEINIPKTAPKDSWLYVGLLGRWLAEEQGTQDSYENFQEFMEGELENARINAGQGAEQAFLERNALGISSVRDATLPVSKEQIQQWIDESNREYPQETEAMNLLASKVFDENFDSSKELSNNPNFRVQNDPRADEEIYNRIKQRGTRRGQSGLGGMKVPEDDEADLANNIPKGQASEKSSTEINQPIASTEMPKVELPKPEEPQARTNIIEEIQASVDQKVGLAKVIESANLQEVLNNTKELPPITDSAFRFESRSAGPETVHQLNVSLPTGRQKLNKEGTGTIAETKGPNIRLTSAAVLLRGKGQEQALRDSAKEIFELNGLEWFPKIVYGDGGKVEVYFGSSQNKDTRQLVTELTEEDLVNLKDEFGKKVFERKDAEAFYKALKENPFGTFQHDESRKYKKGGKLSDADFAHRKDLQSVIIAGQKKLFQFRVATSARRVVSFGQRAWEVAFEKRLKAKVGSEEWDKLAKEAKAKPEAPAEELVLGVSPDPEHKMEVPEWKLGRGAIEQDRWDVDVNFGGPGGDLEKQHRGQLLLRAVRAEYGKALNNNQVSNKLEFLASHNGIRRYAEAYKFTNPEVVGLVAKDMLDKPGLERRYQEFLVLCNSSLGKILDMLNLRRDGVKGENTKAAILIKVLGDVLNNRGSRPLIDERYMPRQQHQNPTVEQTGAVALGAKEEITPETLKGKTPLEVIAALIEAKGGLTLEIIRDSAGVRPGRDLGVFLKQAIEAMGFTKEYEENNAEYKKENGGKLPPFEATIEAINEIYPIYKAAKSRKKEASADKTPKKDKPEISPKTENQEDKKRLSFIVDKNVRLSEAPKDPADLYVIEVAIDTEPVARVKMSEFLNNKNLPEEIKNKPESSKEFKQIILHTLDRLVKVAPEDRDQKWRQERIEVNTLMYDLITKYSKLSKDPIAEGWQYFNTKKPNTEKKSA